ncbi:MAG: C26 family cysteine hydrolase domain-containing family [Phycisphaerae bacterium]|nr:C26 family cysteine hydrolase domain-containing family [Phycisphaerae bacterium]
MTMKSVLVIQHTPAETIGSIAAPLAAANVAVNTCEVFCQQSVPTEIGQYSGLILMGGPMSAYEQDHHPFIQPELALIQSTMAAGKPVLGICLGSQLIAAALGARVYPGRKKEIGWLKVRLHEGGMRDPLFVGVPFSFTAFHWHGDIFEVPQDAIPLLGSDITACQGFRFGAKTWALLCHLEVTAESIQAMMRSFPDELKAASVNSANVIAQTSTYLPELLTISKSVFSRWTALLA